MGIDVHALNFIRSVKNKKPLGCTVTIGRQGLHVDEPLVKDLVGAPTSYEHKEYCEELLSEFFGANKVDSIDNSSYENATHIHNMNKPLPKDLYENYDTVIDGGCLEHIYNVPQALMNCSHLCKPGGQVLHILPANNFCGHGFWQFSPELFFSLYSERNGYRETEVFVADLSDTRKWYQVKPPKDGRRVKVSSSTELYLLVRTVVNGPDFSHSEVQQSDYVYEWEKTTSSAHLPFRAPQKLKKKRNKASLVHKLVAAYHFHFRSKTKLNAKNPGLTAVDVTF